MLSSNRCEESSYGDAPPSVTGSLERNPHNCVLHPSGRAIPDRLVDAAPMPDLQDQDKGWIVGDLNYHSVVPNSKPAVRDPDETTKGAKRVRLK